MLRWIVRRFLGSNASRGGDQDGISGVLEQRRKARQPDFDRIDEFPYDHYTSATEDIKQFKRDRQHAEAIELLQWCIDFAEAEARHHTEIGEPSVVPPWYYKHLGIVYRKEDRYADEVAILERYMDVMDELGMSPRDELVDRLERARELAD